MDNFDIPNWVCNVAVSSLHSLIIISSPHSLTIRLKIEFSSIEMKYILKSIIMKKLVTNVDNRYSILKKIRHIQLFTLTLSSILF